MLVNRSKYVVYKARASQCNEEMIQTGILGTLEQIFISYSFCLLLSGIIDSDKFQARQKENKLEKNQTCKLD